MQIEGDQCDSASIGQDENWSPRNEIIFSTDPVGDDDPSDPLATSRKKTRVAKKPFVWPRLDKSFLRQVEFVLPSDYANIMMEKARKIFHPSPRVGPKLVAKVKGRPRNAPEEYSSQETEPSSEKVIISD